MTQAAINPHQEGVKLDGGKPMWELLSLNAVEGIVDVLTYGANKYTPHGWATVPDAKNRYYAALMRHLKLYRDGVWLDEESGLPHLHHVACNIIFLMELERMDEHK